MFHCIFSEALSCCITNLPYKKSRSYKKVIRKSFDELIYFYIAISGRTNICRCEDNDFLLTFWFL